MSVRQPSEAVSSFLDALYAAYEGFDVTQTTVSVDPEEFAAVRERGDVAEVRVEVESEAGTLAVPGEDEWQRPGGVVDDEGSLTAAAEAMVRRQTGVDCAVEDLQRVSLVCLQCEATGDQVWELLALFDGAVESGSPTADAAWRESIPESSPAF